MEYDEVHLQIRGAHTDKNSNRISLATSRLQIQSSFKSEYNLPRPIRIIQPFFIHLLQTAIYG